jgi:flagellar biosynthetic protein FlhB
MADDHEDRTQGPSKLRLLQARERGQVAQSAELTAAAGLLAAALLLGARGDQLAALLIALVREPLGADPIITADAVEVIARLRHFVLAVAWPLGLVVIGAAVAALGAHQAQAGGLWAPGLLAPDPSRLWSAARGPGLAARWGRGLWSLVKGAVVLAVAAWAIRSGWPGYQRLSGMEAHALARASGHAIRHLTLALAVATLILGLIDYALQHQRFEALLRMTPEEQREDIRSMEGDPVLRSRRRQLARSWRADPGEVLVGASLVLTGPAGLTLVIGGGPPPRRVSVRTVVRGASGTRLRRAAESANLPRIDAPNLAHRLSRRPTPALPVPAGVLAELAALWPSPSTSPGIEATLPDVHRRR